MGEHRNFLNVRRGQYASSLLPVLAPYYDDLSLDSRRYGKASIECCLKSSKCVRGVLSQGISSLRPATALYFDLTFDQPNNEYVFETASVSLTFTSKTPSGNVSVTEHFGPLQLQGDSREQHFNRMRQLVPTLSVTLPTGSLAIGNLGDTATTDFVRDWHWEFYGQRGPQEHRQRPYHTITWKWLGKYIDKTQTVPRQAMKCAVIVCHDDEPFDLTLHIEGKLRNVRRRLAHYVTRSMRVDTPSLPIMPASFQPEPPTPPHNLESVKNTRDADMLKANVDEFLKYLQVLSHARQSPQPNHPVVSVSVSIAPAPGVDLAQNVQGSQGVGTS